MFTFKDELTYDLDEVLNELLTYLKQQQHTGIPPIIMLDELTITDPLRNILKDSLNAVGVVGTVNVTWYPPPTEEETHFAAMSSGGLM